MTDSPPLTCDLTQAPDNPTERLEAYRRLFTALDTKERIAAGFRFRFEPARLDQALLDRLVALESACCPFLYSGVSRGSDQVWWEVTVDSDEAQPFLDALYELPDTLAGPDPIAGPGRTWVSEDRSATIETHDPRIEGTKGDLS